MFKDYIFYSVSPIVAAALFAAPASAEAIKFVIPEQAAAASIPAFARAANLQILVAAPDLRGVRTNGVVGNFERRPALEMLIRGTGLKIATWKDTVVTLSREGQQASDEAAGNVADDEIVVNGFLRSIGEARDLKRKSNTIKDVIVAEDMAKFPELNLAESLQRVPGVAINREAGEGRRITLRGLGPDYTRVQLNGMEVLGNVDSAMDSRGQRSRDRAFDFNIFASELFSRVEVQKTYEASQNEGGMAGTVGLFTAKPLENKPGLKGAISAKLGTNTYTDDAQPRVAAMAGYNFDDRFGILVSVAYSKRRTQEKGYDTYNPVQLTPAQIQTYLSSGLDISALSAEQQAKFKSGDLVYAAGNRLSVWDARQERLGVTLSTQWRPTDTLLLTLDGLYGKFSTDRDEYHLATRPTSGSGEIIFNGAYSDFGRSILASRINDIRWDSSNFVTYADVDNATYGSEHRRQVNRNVFKQIALTGDWKPSSVLTFDGHVGYEKSTYRTPIDDKLYLQAQGGMITQFAPDGESASNLYKWNTADPDNYVIRELYFRENAQTTTLHEGTLNGRYVLSPVFKLNVGYAYRRYAMSGSDLFNDGLYGAEFKSKPGYDAVTPYALVYDGWGGQPWVAGDWDKALAFYGKSHTDVGPGARTYNTFAIKEVTNAGYVQLDWDGDLGGMTLRGNVGARAYHTETTNTGLLANAAGQRVPSTIVSSYSGILPGLNAVLEVTRDFQVRLAAAQNINRPALTSMKMTGSVQLGTAGYTVSNGNPSLKPYKSTDLDLSAEWYFGQVGMISVGIFHKDIDDLVGNETLLNVPYSVTGLSTDLAPGLTPDTNVVQYTRPVNLAKARLTGLEMAAQGNFTFLPAPFDNLGALANVTLIDSNTKVNGRNGPITGLSDINANGTLYYETKLWGIRGSANFRSGYLLSRYDGRNPVSEDGFKSTVYVDAAAFVNIRDGIRLTLDAINITNQPEIQINSIYDRLHNVTRSGTTLFAGLNVSF
ncbi:TonB-dependent receptor [Novosphingobium album (ex Liu et al. 2023)]|uniref:TonB-dependent receptor n=1 Tax=Novosphingobium album (ex Liu et al. 2023) TaxID=3031130 RepID=A0ABT5WMN0_9SPHN|nr:TonB-dependent receptor [Novosphingobium album (ex Liu et al. 2023)]MDE8650188.1 TonB-dependent receptor [Novosphingobium album (ex Liu et al. 2023)]